MAGNDGEIGRARWLKWEQATGAKVTFFGISAAIEADSIAKCFAQPKETILSGWTHDLMEAASGGDGERKGLDFLPPDSTAQSAWKAAWPRRGNPPNWDAVGRVRVRGVHEWLLVEAKANTEELESTCGASPEGGLDLITSTLRATKKALGVAADRDWLRGYYQFANRLAVLNILDSVGLPARLLLIYFVGDQNSGFTCPADQAQWRAALETQDRHLGISVRHRLADRVNKLFLEVSPMDAGNELTFS